MIHYDYIGQRLGKRKRSLNENTKIKQKKQSNQSSPKNGKGTRNDSKPWKKKLLKALRTYHNTGFVKLLDDLCNNDIISQGLRSDLSENCLRNHASRTVVKAIEKYMRKKDPSSVFITLEEHNDPTLKRISQEMRNSIPIT